MSIDALRQIIRDNNRIVIHGGIGLTDDSGIPNFLSPEESFKVEDEFGVSPEDLFSSVYFSTRPELFFQYYKKYILFLEQKPNASHYAIVELEKQGKVHSVITKSFYGLHGLAGSKNVIELHGSIHKNVCIKCGKSFSAQYVKESSGIPCCSECKSVLRPKVGLIGEQIDNGVLTKAYEAVANADVFIIAGERLHSLFLEKALENFKGNHVILINEEYHFSDSKASLIIHDRPINVLPYIF